jgi:predicted nucleotidyltransferase
VETLAEVARRSDDAVRAARAELVRAVRDAAARGMSQRQIASEIGRSQPEVARLVRFHGATPLGRRLRSVRRDVLDLVQRAGGRNVRVFGSVARGDDADGSDVDLLFTMTRPLGLLELEALQARLAELVGADVDLIPDDTLLPPVARRVAEDAVPL